MNSVRMLVVVVSMIATAVVATAQDHDGPSDTTKVVIHTKVDRVAGKARDPELLGRTSPESDARIAELQDRLMQERQHPPAGPPFETVEIPAEALVPLNPPTPPGDSEGAASPVVLYVNSAASNPAPVGYRSEVAEPAVAASGNRVFYTANWFGSTSANGGADFNFVNPSPGPFAQPLGESFCCDQTMAHDPGSNTLFWLQQFIPSNFNPPSTDTGTQRINVDQNADGSWDCAYDITTTLVGLPSGSWFDFPDLTVSANYLYHASNSFTFSFGWAGGYVGRYPLAELAACSSSLSIDAFTSGWGSFRLTRGADDTMYFAAHQSNTAIRIWSWPDAAPQPASVLRSVAPWSNGSRLCPGPDGRNWCGFHDGRIQSGFVAQGRVGFIWTPSQGGGFPFPYMRIATFDADNDLGLVEEIDVWSPDVAYMYPSASVNSVGELGGTVMWGGGDTHYASCSAWMATTPTAGGLVPLNHTTSIAGTVGPSNGNSRSGDYTMSTTYYPDDLQFAGACFAYLSLGSGAMTYVRFGSDTSGELFTDDFESAGLTAWSLVAP